MKMHVCVCVWGGNNSSLEKITIKAELGYAGWNTQITVVFDKLQLLYQRCFATLENWIVKGALYFMPVS